MDIKCPACLETFPISALDDRSVCPACHASLEIDASNLGFALVSAVRKESVKVPEPAALSDQVLQDYSRWRMGAIFAVLFGAVALSILGISILNDMAMFGKYALQVLTRPGFESITGVCALLLIIGGAWLFFYIGNEKKRYLRALEHEQTDEIEFLN